MNYTIQKGKYGSFVETGTTDIKILQLTDLQVIDSSQCRYSDRLCKEEFERWRPENTDKCGYSYIREAVETTKPDIIIFTGELVYGEFDDSGRQFVAFADFMGSLRVPWAPVFGNHDNETKTGIAHQCDVLENAKNCLFMRGDTDGNGNYSVTLTCDGKPFRTILMLDSHGCSGTKAGIYDSQVDYCEKMCEEIKDKYGVIPPLFAGYHIATDCFNKAAVCAGYEDEGEQKTYAIGKDIPAKCGDFGHKYENFGYLSNDTRFFEFFTKNGGDGIFCGHWHKINTSILYKGVRLTMGLKTGVYDYHEKGDVGSTLVTLNGLKRGEFTVRHIYSEL